MCFNLWLSFFSLRYNVVGSWKCTEQPQNDIRCHKYCIYTKYLTLRHKFWSISLYDLASWRLNLDKIGKALNNQFDLEHLTVKSTLIAVVITAEVKILVRFEVQQTIFFKTQGC